MLYLKLLKTKIGPSPSLLRDFKYLKCWNRNNNEALLKIGHRHVYNIISLFDINNNSIIQSIICTQDNAIINLF